MVIVTIRELRTKKYLLTECFWKTSEGQKSELHVTTKAPQYSREQLAAEL